MSKYSNFRATMAMAKASFRSIVRSPSMVVFSLVFPLVFIVVFGFIGGGGITIRVGIDSKSDTSNIVYQGLKKVPAVRFIRQPEKEMSADLDKGRIDAVLNIVRNEPGSSPAYTVHTTYTNAAKEKGNIFRSMLSNVLITINNAGNTAPPPVATIKEATVEGRKYKTIDFILPGQLGFSLLSTGVFGTAFLFLSLRITLVIKRFFATPVKRASIVIGEAISRVTFALAGALIIILMGHYLFGFTLVNGAVTVINMLILSTIGLLVFMGFGFIVSGLAKTESSIPPIANLITLPQFLLSGTFFSIEAFPSWLQPISRALPLTYLNDAMRMVAFEGAGLADVGFQIMILGIWGVAVYLVAIKVFRWE